MSAEMVHPLGSVTVQEWLDEAPPPDGSKRELILGNVRVSPQASRRHQFIGDGLCALFWSAKRLAGRRGIYPVTAINALLSTARRTAVVPDAAIVNTSSDGVLATPAQIELVVEVWSPGNSRRERAEKFDAYAQAGIRYFWTVDLDGPVVDAYELRAGRYQLMATLKAGNIGTITAAPVPVTFDPAELLPDE